MGTDARGQIEREPSKVLLLIHPPSRQIEAEIDTIREAYRLQFGQEAVMKVTVPVRGEF